MSQKSVLRCAIYTRKSSEEGLGQEFNSLDAQREACAAYVASQKHEGWKLIGDRYDDGGLSGGTLARPALQRLLADIDAGRVQMVVVYKIDRLTRSLADFAKLVERLEKAGCSFVSVTQAFNTSSSMGRLTLNVLLSFAQFEREVTAERIRDKIAASKRKGLWMGGTVPLGYDRHPDAQRRELVVNEAEAEQVRALFHLYDQHGNLRDVEDAATARGMLSKRRALADGRGLGGRPLSRGQIHYLLTNVTYRGLTRHKAEAHPGTHPAIVGQDLWDRVQAKLQARTARPRGEWGRLADAVVGRDAAGGDVSKGFGADHDGGDHDDSDHDHGGNGESGAPGDAGSRGGTRVGAKPPKTPVTPVTPVRRAGAQPTAAGRRWDCAPAPLLGRLRDETGDRLTPTHTVKDGRRLRYYVSHRLIRGPADRAGWRLPGPALERAVAEALARHLEQAAAGHTLLAVPDVHRSDALAQAAGRLVEALRGRPDVDAGRGGAPVDGEADAGSMMTVGDASGGTPRGTRLPSRDDALRHLVAAGRLAPGRLDLALDAGALATALGVSAADLAPALLAVSVPFALRRRGVELKLVAGTPEPDPDRALVTALARAHAWVRAMRRGTPIAEIAVQARVSESYVVSRARLAFLAPRLQAAILDGTQPSHLTLEKIVRAGVPLAWHQQARIYGMVERGEPGGMAERG